MTYAELEARSNQVANLLIELGVRRGDRVGIFLRKSMESVIGIYGVMKAGACYVPLDPGAPAARIGYIAGNSGIRHLVTGTEKRRSWATLRDGGRRQLAHLVVLDDADPDAVPGVDGMPAWSADAVDRRPTDGPTPGGPQDLAYMLYTSGSTGPPKGVMLSHRNATGSSTGPPTVRPGPDDLVSSHAPLHFDLSVFDLYAAAHARRLVPFPSEMSVFPVRSRSSSTGTASPSGTRSLLTMLVEPPRCRSAPCRVWVPCSSPARCSPASSCPG